MSFIVLQVLLLFICNSYYCLSQDTEELLFASVREAIGEIKAIGQKVTEMENTMSSKFEDMENTMSSKFEEMENTTSAKLEDMENTISSKFEEMENTTSAKLEEMENTMSSKLEGQLAEIQGSSNVEVVLQLCAETMEMEREFQRETFNRTFNEMDQIANLQESFSTELNRIEHSISSKLSNLQDLGVAERELHRQTSTNISTKMDQIANLQESFATELKRIEPSISSKVSNLQQLVVAGCPTGFTNVPGAGCLKEIKSGKTFDDAITYCSTLGARLVVPLLFQGLQDYVGPFTGYGYWVGARGRKWLIGRDVAQEEWLSGEPDGDVTECAFIERSSLRIRDTPCGGTYWFICQLK